MIPAVTTVTLKEWEVLSPDSHSELVGRSLLGESDRRLVDELASLGKIQVSELRSGLMIRAFSHVGRIRLGDLEIVVQPKLDQQSLLELLRYAYGFRQLKLLPRTTQQVDQSGFADLLVSQLLAEIRELIARGLHRSYVPRDEWLSALRGRIDIGRLAADGGVITASLPCTYHPRVEDSLVNRVILAGLELAARLAGDIHLRRDARRLASLLAEGVSPIRLDGEVLETCARSANRLTVAYEAALVLVRLLWEAQGVTFSQDRAELRLPGFLFDMNRFFQALLSRFLHENLPEHTVRDEQRLRGMLQFVPGFNPRRRQPPTPRPDFVLLRGGRQVAVLDAKYRDLWEKPLPREMLYQLAMYAIVDEGRTATILFPTLDPRASEARIQVQDAMFGRHMAQVLLRPIVLPAMQPLLSRGTSPTLARRKHAFAEWLVYGGADPTSGGHIRL